MFVGIDVSKATLDVAWLEAEQVRTRRVGTTSDAIAALIAELARDQPQLVVLEATGVYHLALLEALVGAGVPVSLVNPLQVKGVRQTLGLRTKTDRVDARLLAQFAQQYADQLRRYTPAPALQQELADWMPYRDQVVDTLTRLRNQLEAARHRGRAAIVSVLEADLAHALGQREQADAAIRALLSELPEAAVLVAMTGVGLVTTAAVLAWLPVELWGDAKAAAAYAGVCPQEQSSGQQTRSFLSQQGHRRLRRVLFCATRVAVKHDPVLQAFYERLILAGKPAKVALCAAMHKLLRRMMGRLRALHQTQQRPQAA